MTVSVARVDMSCAVTQLAHESVPFSINCRRQLLPFRGKTLKWECQIGRFGCRRSVKGSTTTVRLDAIKQRGSDAVLVEHVWVDAPQALLNLQSGDTIAFEATVETYLKGQTQKSKDLKINNLKRVKLLARRSEDKRPSKALKLAQDNGQNVVLFNPERRTHKGKGKKQATKNRLSVVALIPKG